MSNVHCSAVCLWIGFIINTTNADRFISQINVFCHNEQLLLRCLLVFMLRSSGTIPNGWSMVRTDCVWIISVIASSLYGFSGFCLSWTSACLIKHKLAIHDTFFFSIQCVCTFTFEAQMLVSSVLLCSVTRLLQKQDQTPLRAEEDVNPALFKILKYE